MQTAPPSPDTTPAPPAAPPRGRLVTDAPTRMFHWLFAACFTGAYLTGDSEHWRALHVTLGYALAGLLAWRLAYGVWGPRHARLGLLWRRVRGMPAWLRACWRTPGAARIDWRQGQNLLLAGTLVAMLALAVPLAASGYAAYDEWGDLMEELHELMGQLMLGAVLAHLGLLAGLSLLRRRNQAAPMLSGRTGGTGPDLVQHNRAWLAALLLLAVAAFVAWQWNSSPQGLWPDATAGQASGPATAAHPAGRGHHDDDDDDDD